MKRAGTFALVMIFAAGFASCSQPIGVPPSTLPITAQDFFWQPAQLSGGVNYNVVRNGVGSNHLLRSHDGHHIGDGALNNEVTMVVHASADSVLLDSMGVNSIFSLPSGYYFGADSSAPKILVRDTIVSDTMVRDTVVRDSVRKDTSGNNIIVHYTQIIDTVIRITTIQERFMPDTSAGRLLLLLRTAMDSGRSWHAGMLFGPGIPSGMPVTATVLDHVDSLRIPPARPGADSTFGESFQIRYAPQQPVDSGSAAFPIYWIAYYSRNVGPVLIEQYTLGLIGQYSLTERAQIIGRGP